MPPLTPQDNSSSGRDYWRSLEQHSRSEQFREFMFHEFPAQATDMLDGEDRRHFLKIMGASLALAGFGMSGCRRWPEEKIVPFASRPADRVPGNPQFYATAMEVDGVGRGLLAKSQDGRPIKIEGNDKHPSSLGATDSYNQASVLDLYDPDRSLFVRHDGDRSNFVNFEAFIEDHFANRDNSQPLHVLAEATSSPSIAAMRSRLSEKFSNLKWHVWSPINDDNARAGSILAFGRPYRTHHRFNNAEVVVSLDSDFLLNHPDAVRNARGFAQTRRVNLHGHRLEAGDHREMPMSRLYAVESNYTITGAMADERLAVRSSDIAMIAADLAKAVTRQTQPSGPHAEWIKAMADDLREHAELGMVVAGRNQPPIVHALVHQINAYLGGVGTTVLYTPEPYPDQPTALESIKQLTAELNAGEVGTLVILGANPVYTAPADLDFARALAQAKTSVHLGYHYDETAKLATWHIPQAHYLENWADTRGYDGTISIVQPLIQPLIAVNQGGRSAIELLATLAGEETDQGYDIVRSTIKESLGWSDAEFETNWRQALHDGIIAETAWQSERPEVRTQQVDAAMREIAEQPGGLEIVFHQDPKVYDGRFANNGWLQELPHPMTKVTWDNAAVMSVPTAAKLGVETGDMVRLAANGRTMEAAAFVLPGHADGSISIALGYGREDLGRIGDDAGFNAYTIRTSNAMNIATDAEVASTGGEYLLASTQDHGAANEVAQEGIARRLPTLVREADLNEYREHPDFARHRTHVVHRLSLWDETSGREADHAWAMSIDLSTCTGCSACVVACQAENNIPLVGKAQVAMGREMHWIRLDRYFRGRNPESPEGVSVQPVTCQHCANAPCESVCPVAATVHDDEGLNVMVYNRCIGTRYCSNNCPYKVRRFNYLDWHRRKPHREDGVLVVDPDYYTTPQAAAKPRKQMQYNPEVTVRPRGVMEKCTFCVQRINKAKIEAKNEWVQAGGEAVSPDYTIPDGTITPACAGACPSNAIVFGDLNNPDSLVGKLHRDEKSYEMLEELNTKPRLRYLARINNPIGGGSAGDGHGGHNGHEDSGGQGDSGGHGDDHSREAESSGGHG